MYLIISFNFSGESDVRIHFCTNDLQRATEAYNRIVSEHQEKLVELCNIPEYYCNMRGRTLFWNNQDDRVETIMTNNI